MRSRAGLACLVRTDLETDQRVGAEGVGDRHVSCIAPLSDQHAAYSRHVVPRIECVPSPAKIGLEPAGEIHWAIGRWYADVPKVAGAIARRNVHAAAERDGEVRVVATHTLAFIEDLPGRHRWARMLVAEGDVVMDEIADRLDARPPRWRLCKRYYGSGLRVPAFRPSSAIVNRRGKPRNCPADTFADWASISGSSTAAAALACESRCRAKKYGNRSKPHHLFLHHHFTPNDRGSPLENRRIKIALERRRSFGAFEHNQIIVLPLQSRGCRSVEVIERCKLGQDLDWVH